MGERLETEYIPLEMKSEIQKPGSDGKNFTDLELLENIYQPNEKDDKVAESSLNVLLTKSLFQLRDATMPQLSRDHRIVKLIWVCVYIGLLLTFALSFFTIVQRYRSYPTLIEIEIVSRPKLTFPAVTVCNENPVRKSLIGRFKDYQDLLVLDDFVQSSVQAFAADAFKDVSLLDCRDGYHKCPDSGECVPPSWVCNDIRNCNDGSDESEDVHDCEAIKEERLTSDNKTGYDIGECRSDYVFCPVEYLCAIPCDGNSECTFFEGFDESPYVGCEPKNCSETLYATAEKRSFTSLNFPENYEENMYCTTVIKTQNPSSRILITFDEIDLEGSPGNCMDYLEVYDGDSTNATAFKQNGQKKICGDKVPEPSAYLSSGPSMTVVFKTDFLLNRKGFKLFYETMSKEAKTRRSTGFRTADIETVSTQDDDCESSIDEEEPNISERFKAMKGQINKIPQEKPLIRKMRSDQASSEVLVVSENEYGDSKYETTEAVNYGQDYDYEVDYEYGYQYYTESRADYFSLYRNSKVSDYSDFRKAAYFYQRYIYSNGHQRTDFIVQCTFDGRDCPRDFFRMFEDPLFGNCFSFNSIRGLNMSRPLKLKSSSKTGREFGLKLTLFLDSEEYIGLLAHNTGARVIVHDPYLKPEVESESFAVSAGDATFLAVKMEVTDRLGGQYDNCSSEWPQSLLLNEKTKTNWPRYSLNACLSYCIINQMASRCGCTDTFDLDFSTDEAIQDVVMNYCEITNKTQTECRQKVYSDFQSGRLTCECPQECHTVEFKQQESRAPWPSKSYTPYFTAKMLKSTSKRVVDYMAKIVSAANATEDDLQKKLRENFARLEIYYQALNFRRMSESAAYDVSALVSDFGGNISLWLGWSIFVLFELVQFVFHCAEAVIISRKNNSK